MYSFTTMSLNVFADEVGRYQMLEKTPSDNDKRDGIYVLDTKRVCLGIVFDYHFRRDALSY